LFLLGLAALALTVSLGCCDQQARERRAAARAQKARARQAAAVVAKVGAAVAAQAAEPVPEQEPARAALPKPEPKGEAAALPKQEPQGDAPAAPPKKAPVAKRPRESWVVKVWVQGRNRPEAEAQREAEDKALQQAHENVVAYLRRQSPPLTWTPSAAYVRKHLLDGTVKRLPEEDQDIPVQAGGLKVQRWALTVAITEQQYQEMVRLDREARGAERMALAGKVLGGLLLLLVAVMGYLHLDEQTGGAYTRWLRLGLGSLLAGVAAGVWLLA
jgi:hypothetical protein